MGLSVLPLYKPFLRLGDIMTYVEKLKDPRWQKKRLERLEMSKFTCDNCNGNEEELHVHHKYYQKGKDPWDYEFDDFIVFCKGCHDSWHEAKSKLDKVIGNIHLAKCIDRISGYASFFMARDIFKSDLADIQNILGFSDLFRTDMEAIISLWKKSNSDLPISIPKILYKQIQGPK
jgi:hypothetical protein